MESLEISGKTVEEATQTALKQLGMTEDQVEITILKKGKPGILGLGAEEARVLVKPKVQVKTAETARVEIPQSSGEQLPEPIAQAKNILEKLLSTMKIPASVEVVPWFLATENGEAPSPALDIKGGDLGLLIGRRGQTLTTLQYIVNLILSQKTRLPHPVIVDVEGYKQRRYQALQNLAIGLAEQVKKNRRSIAMEPMPADERRIVHISLAKMPEISTESSGEGDNRKVIISYKKPTP